jgi:uncharacterized membrane protein
MIAYLLYSIGQMTGFSIIIYAAPNALFVLMALFLWLDTARHRAFLHLFIAGKSISILTILGWSIISGQVTIIKEFILLSGDLFSIAAILLISRDIPAVEG